MERTYTLQDLAAAFRRRWLIFLIVTVGLLAAAAMVIMSLPDEYRAESVVQIEPHQLAADFLPAATTAPFEDRMRTLKHGLLARPVLERVIRETQFYPKLADDMDAAVERLRRNVEVRLEGEVAAGPPALLFTVEVHGPDREKVAKAAELLPKYYAEMTEQVLSDQAHNLRTTLDNQLSGMGKEMAAMESKLVSFKTTHAFELPESIESNMRAQARLEAQMEIRLSAITDAQRRRTMVLTSIPELASDAGRAQTGADDALRRLTAARATYGPDHPDVKRLEREYQETKARVQDEERRYQRERIQDHVARIDGEIQDNNAAIRDLRKDLTLYQGRLDATPRWGAELANLSREYEALKIKYAATLGREADARAAQALFAADQGALFRFVQPAEAPLHPSGPARLLLLLAAFAVALAAGSAASAFAELLDSSLRGPEDATGLGAPVLASIPHIGTRRANP